MRDPAFPALHIRPERGWLNDPNGLCRWDGAYHVFFQYNPASPLHGNVHWGHVSSTDWCAGRNTGRAEPATGRIDAAGCWSGCIVDDGGVPTAVYTANPDHAWQATVGLARSDGRWSRGPSRRPGDRHAGRADVDEVRDPFVFAFDGPAVRRPGRRPARRPPPAAALRLRRPGALGRARTRCSPTRTRWRRRWRRRTSGSARIWPSWTASWVLVVSLWRWVDGTHRLAGVRYLLGDLVSARRRAAVQGDGRRGAGRRAGVLRAPADGRRRADVALGLGLGAGPRRRRRSRRPAGPGC